MIKTPSATALLFVLLFTVVSAISSGCSVPESHDTFVRNRLRGRLSAFDSANYSVPEQMVVSLVGSQYSTHPDSKGNWEITNVDSGYYTLKIQREGWGTYYDFTVTVKGTLDTVSIEPELHQMTASIPMIDSVDVIDREVFDPLIHYTGPVDSANTWTITLLSTDSNLRIENTASFDNIYFERSFSRLHFPFSVNDILYVRNYYGRTQDYFDPLKHRRLPYNYFPVGSNVVLVRRPR